MSRFGLRKATALLIGMAVIDCRSAHRSPESQTSALSQAKAQALGAYVDLAVGAYGEALAGVQALDRAVAAFLSAPTAAGLVQARKAWIAARASYGQTEAFRFSGGPIDRLEPLIDAWPIDESVIDYVVGAPSAGMVNDGAGSPELSAEHLVAANEREGETSISTGYHAVEFLLWGQDRSTTGPGARPYTDYLPSAPNGRRRATYLREVTGLLVRHLTAIVQAWSAAGRNNYRAELLAMPPDRALSKAWHGVVTLLSSEIAGERLTVAYETQDQEDEQSCFSDNTHNDLIFAVLGIDRLLRGDRQPRAPAFGFLRLIGLVDAALAEQLLAAAKASLAEVRTIPPPFDQAIRGDDAADGRRAVMRSIQALRNEASTLARAGAALGLEL